MQFVTRQIEIVLNSFLLMINHYLFILTQLSFRKTHQFEGDENENNYNCTFFAKNLCMCTHSSLRRQMQSTRVRGEYVMFTMRSNHQRSAIAPLFGSRKTTASSQTCQRVTCKMNYFVNHNIKSNQNKIPLSLFFATFLSTFCSLL